jgi:hypothetical protein
MLFSVQVVESSCPRVPGSGALQEGRSNQWTDLPLGQAWLEARLERDYIAGVVDTSAYGMADPSATKTRDDPPSVRLQRVGDARDYVLWSDTEGDAGLEGEECGLGAAAGRQCESHTL